MKGKVLIAAPIHDVLQKGLEEQGYELETDLNITQQTAKEKVKGVVGIVTSTRLQLDEELIDAAPLLQWIGRMGSGMEVIDVAYAAGKGIKCFSSPDGNANAVAEHAVGMLLSLTKKIAVSNEEVKNSQWLREENRGTELEGKTIGIVGFGHTGPALAKKLSGFDMNILVYDKYKKIEPLRHYRVCDTLQPIFEQADILSFHVPLREDTFHYFNATFYSQFQKPIILINTSRGTVIETNVLLKGLQEGKIVAACLDVFEEEPLPKMSVTTQEKFKLLTQMKNVIITPHIAGYSHEALFKMSQSLLKKIVINVQ